MNSPPRSCEDIQPSQNPANRCSPRNKGKPVAQDTDFPYLSLNTMQLQGMQVPDISTLVAIWLHTNTLKLAQTSEHASNMPLRDVSSMAFNV